MNDDVMKSFLLHSVRGVIGFAMLMLFLALTSCKSTRTITKLVEVPGETIVLHDTLHIADVSHIRDSVYEKEQTLQRGDTVYQTRYKYVERTRRDTLRKEVVVEKPVEIPKPYPVEVEVERTEPLITRLLKAFGVLALGFVAGYIVKLVRR